MTSTWKWSLSLCLLTGVGALLAWAFIEGRAEMQREREREAPVTSPSRVTRGQDGPVVTLTESERTRLGIDVAACAAAPHQVTRLAFGALEVDPSATVVVRASVAGTIRTLVDHPWPQLGDTCQVGVVVGRLAPRLTVTDLVDLRTRLAAATSEATTATAALETARAAAHRAQILNQDQASVSQQVVEEANLRVQTEAARLATATATIDLINGLLGASAGSTTADESAHMPIVVPIAGTVVEVMAAPGEVVDSGQPILRIVDYGRLVARVHLPSEDGAAAATRATVLRTGDSTVVAATIQAVVAVAPGSLGSDLVLRLEKQPPVWRPGQAVTARIEVGNGTETGVVIPRSAVIRHAGTGWVYLQQEAEHWSRRPVSLDEPTEDGWFQPRWEAVSIAIAGAQGLLSEELKSSIQVGEDDAGK